MRGGCRELGLRFLCLRYVRGHVEPFLYYFTVELGEDRAESYFAMRTFTIEPDQTGVPRICLNHKVRSQKGVLDQGYWPDGLYTAPSDEAFIFDIQSMKDMGFNMIRKHIKIEPQRWYYHCDRLGMVVWQDMVNGGGKYKPWFVTYAATILSWRNRKIRDVYTRLLARERKEGRLEFIKEMILFLNRRGNSRMALCSQCGEVPTCPRCSVHLTYHSANGRLMCDYCGYSMPLPEVCPHCAGRFQFVGMGTQKLQEELQALYPDVEVMRMDADTITATRSHEVLLDRFRRKKVPILLGTQMVAKGLDFPNVTLVGVVDGDLSLYADNYSGRRTDLLPAHPSGGPGRTRGQAGAGHHPSPGPRTTTSSTWLPARTMIPFTPGSGRCAACFAFPPFLNLFRITISGPEETQVLRACAVVRRSLDPWIKPRQHGPDGPEVLGPAPAPILKINNRYRYRVGPGEMPQ